MTAVRAVLIATIILGLAATPLVAPAFGGASSSDPTAYAAFMGGTGADGHPQAVLANNNNDNEDNFNDNGDNFNNNNDNNNNGNGNGNSNNNNGNGNGNGNDNNGNDNVVVIVRHPNESFNRPTKCFDTRELGTIQLGRGSFDVTVQVMPHSSFNQTTRLTLRRIEPSTVPSPGNLVDNVVFQLDAQSSCDGAHIGQLPNLVNMGIVYNVPQVLDKSKLQLVRLDGSTWTNVDTVPDPTPGNPYVSTTTGVAGTYALIVKP
jgi:hypothetical protein